MDILVEVSENIFADEMKVQKRIIRRYGKANSSGNLR